MDVNPLELEHHRKYLVRLAVLQLRDEAQAQDVVQETFAAALTANFQGGSSLKTWLTGILKHKIIDMVRRESRFVTLATDDNDEIPESSFDDLFKANNHWAEAPSNWRTPDEALSDQQFQAIFQLCTERLQKKHAQIFMMREVMDMPIEEICNHLEITTTNCSVILYRARMSLRLCLEQKWFEPQRSV